MLPDDVFNRDFDAVVTRLERQLDGLDGTATIEREAAKGYWRARILPNVSSACGMELALHRNQRFDLALGSEVADGQVIASLRLFPQILEAVSKGQLIERTLVSAVTGAPIAREMIATLSDGPHRLIRRALSAAARESELDALRVDHHFVPYVRS